METKLTEEDIQTIKGHMELLKPYYIFQLIRCVMERKIIVLNYKKNGKTVTKFFELKNDLSSFYSDHHKTITLYSFIEDTYETINFDDIEMYRHTTEDPDTCPNFKRRHKLKECYYFFKEKIKQLNLDYNLDSTFFDPLLITPQDLPYMVCLNIEDANSYYNSTSEQLESYRQTLLVMLKEEANKQKQIITTEFETLQKENSSLESEELKSILFFIDNVVETTTFQEYSTAFEMFDNWPTILTSPSIKWFHNNPWGL